MRRITLFALLALLLLSVGMTAAQQDATPFQVVDVAPAANNAALDAAVTIYFDRPVNCASAQAALQISPNVAGTLTCNAAYNSVTFLAAANYAPDSRYTFSFDSALTAQDGTALAAPFSYVLATQGNLAVTQVLPADGSDGVQTDSTITVIFNRPVVPLGVSEDSATLPQPLTFAPAVTGQGEWLNTSIYVFHPDPALQGGRSYTVKLDPALTAVDGATLAGAFSWSFSTVAPAISSLVPEDTVMNVDLDATLQVRFNQPMDQASVEASFSLHPLNSTQTVAGTFTWSDDGAGFRFTPDANLSLATDYIAEFTGDLPLPEGGGAVLSGQTEWGFRTVPAPSILGTDPGNGDAGVYPYSGFRIYFASPMNPDTLKDHVTISPEPANSFDTYYSNYDNSYSLSFPTDPSTDYTVTITSGMEDVYGNTISGQKVVHFTTAPSDPAVNLQVPGDIGFYNAYNPQTQLFLTHLNVSQIDLSLYSVSQSDLISALTGQNSYNPTATIQTGFSNQLRMWSIPNVAPENMYRYELLNLGGGSVDCPGAPPSRLHVGATAIVISDPDPLRARASAPDGAVINSLYKDYQLPIIGGPTCANNLLWWEVTLRDGTSAWVAEGTPDEYFLDLKEAPAATPVVVTGADGEALNPGIYLLTVTLARNAAERFEPPQAPAGRGDGEPDAQVFLRQPDHLGDQRQHRRAAPQRADQHLLRRQHGDRQGHHRRRRSAHAGAAAG